MSGLIPDVLNAIDVVLVFGKQSQVIREQLTQFSVRKGRVVGFYLQQTQLLLVNNLQCVIFVR
jgi:hypothetical protein